MTKSFNIYGDDFIPTTGAHGTNISQQRPDRLDNDCLDFLKQISIQQDNPCAIDLGGGAGAQSLRMAKLGVDVTLIDLSISENATKELMSHKTKGNIQILSKDIRDIPDKDLPQKLDCIYSQRMINYLTYHETLYLMQRLKNRATINARFYISSGGLNTEYGASYSDKDKIVEQRFGHLSQDMSKKHDIHVPVCLYLEEELITLLHKAGLKIIDSWTSDFGNPKIIATI